VAPEAEAPDFEAGYHPEIRKSQIAKVKPAVRLGKNLHIQQAFMTCHYQAQLIGKCTPYGAGVPF
jgi:hypothetical protein